MKASTAILVFVCAVTAQAAKEQVCAVAEIKNHAPVGWEQKVISGTEPIEMQTESGLYKAKITPMPNGLSITLTCAGVAVGGYFESSATTPLLSLHVNGTHGQVNCWL